MVCYSEMNVEQLENEREELLKAFEDYKALGLKLDMSRGKPGADQLDLSLPMMKIDFSESGFNCSQGVDIRNYGVLDGLKEAKELMSYMVDMDPENIMVFGNSSLNIMFDTVARSFTHGVMGNTPWYKLDKVKFLCPTPGYDRHFAITEHFGVEMIEIPMTPDGPDMNMIEEYVNNDESVKGIWCIPKYSNPQGITYSDETVRRFAALKPRAKDFRIFWDNAYAIHHLFNGNEEELANIFEECKKAGNEDMVYIFCSTSKVSFPGGGIAAMAASKANLDFVKKNITFQTIGYDKINMMRHVLFFKDKEGLMEHMKKHAAIIRPKFDAVMEALDSELVPRGILTYTKPNGGYFISVDVPEGCAKKVVAMCKEAGVVMTGAGATHPYKNDAKDTNIRIAPTYPSLEELKKACEIFVLCVRLASVEKLLGKCQYRS